MILQVLPHMRVFNNGFDAEGVKVVWSSNPRQLEELWRVNGAGGDDDLSPRLECSFFVLAGDFDTNHKRLSHSKGRCEEWRRVKSCSQYFNVSNALDTSV